MKKLLVLVIALCLFGCQEHKKSKGHVRQKIYIEKSERDYEVTLLFEVDSIKVYRFKDNYRDVYFSSKKGRIDYDYTTGAGKTLIHHTQTTLTN